MKLRKGMIIPVSLVLLGFLLIALIESFRPFNDLVRVSGRVKGTDSLDAGTKRGLFRKKRVQQVYYLYLDAGIYKTTKKVARELHTGDLVRIYTRSPHELFSAFLPDDNIILHLEHDHQVLIDYTEEHKRWYGYTAGLVLISGAYAYVIRKQFRKNV